jgi:hypothetical protein
MPECRVTGRRSSPAEYRNRADRYRKPTSAQSPFSAGGDPGTDIAGGPKSAMTDMTDHSITWSAQAIQPSKPNEEMIRRHQISF